MTPLFKGKPIREALPMTHKLLLHNASKAASPQAFAMHSSATIAETVEICFFGGLYDAAESDELRRVLFQEILSIGSLTWPDCDWRMEEDEEVIGIIVSPR